MIALDQLRSLSGSFHALRGLPEPLMRLLADELGPSENLQAAQGIRVAGEDGVLVGTEARLLAAYTSKLLFKRFPTYQQFDYPYVRSVKQSGAEV